MPWNRLAALALFGLLGCVSTSSIPELPESLDGDGLLVGKIYMPGSYRWNDSQITINGRVHNASLRDGYLAMRLSPGEYTIQNLRAHGWNEKVSQRAQESPFVPVKGGGGGGGRGGSYRVPTYTYVPGSSSVSYYTILPINQKFTIEANRITSIGMYVFLTDPKEPKKFSTVKLENAREMSHFLDTNYPGLMASLADRNLLSAPANYLEAARLPELRQSIASREARAGRFYSVRNVAVAYGSAGTVVTLTPDASGKKEAPPKVKVLDTGTLADIKQFQVQGDRLSFLTADAQVLILENGQLLRRVIPYRVQPQRFRRFSDKGMLVVDNRRRFLTSQDDGLTWTHDESAMLEKPSNRLEVIAARDAAYVYSTRGVPDEILLRHYRQPIHQILPGPRETGRIPGNHYPLLRVTDAGLYIDYRARDFHFKPNGQADWQLRAAPAEKCGLLAIDPAGRVLTVTCNKENYRSDDGGQTWVKRETPATPPAATPAA